MRTRIVAGEDAAEFLVVKDPGVNGVAPRSGYDCRYLPVREAAVGGSGGFRRVIAGQNAAAIGGEKHACRMAWIDEDVVHNHVRRSHAPERLATVDGLPEALGSAGINDQGIRWVLMQNSCPAGG